MKLSIIGTGSFGLALASRFKNVNITMWTKFEEEKNMLIENRGNDKLLPGIKLNNNIEFTNDMEYCLFNSDFIVIAIPIEFLNDTLIILSKYYKKQNILVATKGIEKENSMFTYELIQKHLNTDKIGILSGPTFAIDLANNNPVGFVVATKYKEIFDTTKDLFDGSVSFMYLDDIIGTEICGTIKNIIAIGSGVLYGMGYSNSAVATYITKAINDIKSIIMSLGGDSKTVLSYAGIGDIILTCTSNKSRNYSFGKMIGEKQEDKVINEYISNNTIEGLYSLNGIYKFIKLKNIDSPLIEAIYNLVVNKNNEQFLNYIINDMM